MFQDGSKLPPTYSVDIAKDRPQQTWLLAIRACLKPVRPGARTPATAETKAEAEIKTSGRATGPKPNSSYRSRWPEIHRAWLEARLDPARATSRKAPFTATQFHVLLTLSSKFFSNFHHCTCLLSVSGQYLALRGVYLALRAALSSNSTRGEDQQGRAPPYGPITLWGQWPLSS